MNFIQVDKPPIVNISHYCIGWNQANSIGMQEVFIPDSRRSEHLPIWAASACRTMPSLLRWQHNSSIVYWPHAFTSTQLFKSCAGAKMIKPMLVMLCNFCGWYFLKIVQPPLFSTSSCRLKKKAMYRNFSNGSILINIHEFITLILILISKRLSEIPPTRRNSCITCGTCMKA